MPWILIHNGDNHGQNMALAIAGQVVQVIPVQFEGFHFSPATFGELALAATTHGPLNVIWAGHGNTPHPATVHTGHPLTNAPLRRIAAGNFRRMIEIFRPQHVIFFTCCAGLWIQRNAPLLTPHGYSLNPQATTLYGLTVNLNGFLRAHVQGFLNGTQPDPLPPHALVRQLIQGNRLAQRPVHVSSREWGKSYTPSGAREV
ncbi:hypothetical protein ACFQNF_19975 [Iodobacter arcticus]|uniref:CHAT domain-containing protein n=1 Tax=Iodobacter arcticus TaxID=590593 RepID=A0ABW2R2Z1_9NEIS